MTIIDKEGKIYTLAGPNPLVEKQTTWDTSKLVFHNFEWDEIKTSGEPRRRAPPKEPKINPFDELGTAEEKLVDAPQKTAPEEKIVESPHEAPPEDKRVEVLEEKPPEPQNDGREFDLPYIKYKVLSYCLPANVQKKSDSLYGDSWSTLKYGKKFVFPSVVISSTDLSIEFWTSDPKNQITEKSIIYPFSYEVHNKSTDNYDRVPYDEYRWWKVSSKENKEEGWLFRAFPSDIQPDFSE